MSRFTADVIHHFRDIDPDWSYIEIGSRFDDEGDYPYVWLSVLNLYSIHLKMLNENYHIAIFARICVIRKVTTPVLDVLIEPKDQDK